MNNRAQRMVLRCVAVLIALAAAIDPSITGNRTSVPEISVLAVNAHTDSALARTVAERLSRSFTVLSAPYAGSAATVLVGSHAPAGGAGIDGPVFAVTPDGSGSSATVENVVVPGTAAVDARVPVTAMMRVQNANGKQIALSLFSNGSVVDRNTRQVTGNDARLQVPLSFVPTGTGVVTLRVSASINSATDSSSAYAVVDIRNKKWAVLFFDARPSWMSTFVRRAVERDSRFAATSRIVTSTNVSTDAGKPPATLDDPAVVDLYDAVVVGAPEALSERDVQGLERFLRRRGGSVVLLFDGNRSGKYERLAEFTPFMNTANSLPAIISDVGGDSIAMRTTEWMWPTRLPLGATVLAWSDANNNRAARRPVVWAAQAGAGRIIVSGALDAWKFRDGEQSGFEKFWQQTVAAAAGSSAPAVDIAMPSRPVQAAEEVAIVVTSRAAALAELRTGGASVRAEMAVALITDSGRTAVRVWPTGTPGAFRGTVRAPGRAGTYSLIAAAGGSSASHPLVVASDVRTGNASEPGLLAAYTAAHGGSVVNAADLARLPSLLVRALKPVPRRTVWHPMRSVWWLLPFTLALGLEWLLRRRSGMP